ncbi:AbrB/MazE/SpoVT family DNA-binding domain-containing protein [Paenibacillus gallinarum]|uniref:AbrB/MazE/SpoVT family DNA-binding domain-containing protein n=1 Tax=Paenibacillus gallinarum TaxID=2762232 RepID=A0ABR8T6C8_9BACL|nr:AbrB/MazE/SpoVT family DNA-binding domain-containing protein [Paenibacillus gallinarum]MBD7971282.1 AbrB/MazE/SpoVT family DNA-binding domain-containing protein [Paenibacillus gallinarum]
MLHVRAVSGNGVVTIPKEIRDEMNIKSGDQVAFIKLDTGQYILTKPDSLKSTIMVDPKLEYLMNEKKKEN